MHTAQSATVAIENCATDVRKVKYNLLRVCNSRRFGVLVWRSKVASRRQLFACEIFYSRYFMPVNHG